MFSLLRLHWHHGVQIVMIILALGWRDFWFCFCGFPCVMSVEIGITDDTDGFSGSCFITISFRSSIRTSLIAFSSASAMAISFVNCRSSFFTVTLQSGHALTTSFPFSALRFGGGLERLKFALEFTDVSLMEVFVRLEFPDFIAAACD